MDFSLTLAGSHLFRLAGPRSRTSSPLSPLNRPDPTDRSFPPRPISKPRPPLLPLLLSPSSGAPTTSTSLRTSPTPPPPHRLPPPLLLLTISSRLPSRINSPFPTSFSPKPTTSSNPARSRHIRPPPPPRPGEVTSRGTRASRRSTTNNSSGEGSRRRPPLLPRRANRPTPSRD
jgi:hypothetical protein